ncbi:MAG: CoA ester lyase [Anaerolineales bacterium]|nr:CoA ester lyase [Anaerolineales bacterium]
MRARRALLYMPGDEIKKIHKAVTLDVDCICMDMEDGVASSRKAQARTTIHDALRELDFSRSERLARINPVASSLAQVDLEAVLPARPDGIVVPKVESSEELRWVDEQIRKAEASHGWPLQSIRMLAIIESARAIVDLREIASACKRLDGLIFGAEDLAGDIGAVRTPTAWEVLYARSAVVTIAAAYKLHAIDMVYMDFHNEAGLREECLHGRQLGYSGKQIIHPNQVGPVQAAFTPDEAEINRAQQILRTYADHQAAGVGAFAIDGRMVDAPVIRAAEQVLARARAAGIKV